VSDLGENCWFFESYLSLLQRQLPTSLSYTVVLHPSHCFLQTNIFVCLTACMSYVTIAHQSFRLISAFFTIWEKFLLEKSNCVSWKTFANVRNINFWFSSILIFLLIFHNFVRGCFWTGSWSLGASDSVDIFTSIRPGHCAEQEPDDLWHDVVTWPRWLTEWNASP